MHQSSLFGDSGLPSESEVRGIVEPVAGCFASGITAGWDEWRTEASANLQSKVSPMQRGGTVWDVMLVNVMDLIVASGLQNVEICTTAGFPKVYIEDRVVARVKKMFKSGAVPFSNLSPRGKRWYRNKSVSGIRNYCARVTIGYVLDPAQQDIADVRVSYQVGEDLVWSYSILGNAQTLALPAPGPAPMPAPTTIVIPKDGTRTKEGERA